MEDSSYSAAGSRILELCATRIIYIEAFVGEPEKYRPIRHPLPTLSPHDTLLSAGSCSYHS